MSRIKDYRDRYESLKQTLSDEYNALAYLLFGWITRKVNRVTGYDKILQSARVDDTGPLYLARVIFDFSFILFVGFFLNTISSIFFDLVAAVITSEPVLVIVDRIGIDTEFTFELKSFVLEIAQIVTIPELPIPFSIVIVLLGLIYSIYKIYRPIYDKNERRRQIDKILPRSLSYMYALGTGGLKAPEIARQVAKSEEIHGEVSEEMKRAVRIANRPMQDITSAFNYVADTTPSDNLEDFLDEYTSILNAGSNEAKFLQNKAQQAREQAEEEQEDFIELVELISEIYVVVLVAFPMLFVVLQAVIGLYASSNDGLTQAVIYFGIPGGALSIGAAIYILGKARTESWERIEPENSYYQYQINQEADLDSIHYLPLKINDFMQNIVEYLYRPVRVVRERPHLASIITVPLALSVVAYLIQIDFISLSIDFITNQYYEATLYLFYVPFTIATLPIIILNAIEKRRRRRLRKRAPQVFDNISEAVFQGLSMQDALKITGESGDDKLSNEIERAIHETGLTYNLNGALIKSANRLRSARFTQSIRIVTQANNISADIQSAVQAISDDLEARWKLDKKRIQNTGQYAVIILLAFFVSIGVIAAIDWAFIDFIQGQISEGASSGGGGNSSANATNSSGGGGGFSQDFNKQQAIFFKRIFLHFLIMLGLTSGIVIGIIRSNKITDGLVYSLIMVSAAMLILFFI